MPSIGFWDTEKCVKAELVKWAPLPWGSGNNWANELKI